MFNNVKRKHENRFAASTTNASADPNPEQNKDSYDKPDSNAV
jgi:GTPase